KGDIAIVFGNEKINYVSLKKRIKLQSEKFNVYKKNYIVITENSPIEAIVDFFAAILCKKKPVLVNSNVQINNWEVISKELQKNNEDLFGLFTSGTTGEPKLVMYSNEAVVENCLYLAKISNVRIGINELVLFPFSSLAAMFFQILPTLMHSGTIFYTNGLDYLSDYDKLSFDFSLMTPSLFSIIHKKSPGFFKNTRAILLGGEPIDFEVIKKFSQHYSDSEIIIGYSLTEAGRILAMGNILELPMGSTGKITSEKDVRIVTTNNQSYGEIQFYSYNKKVWVGTGDIGYIKDNYLFVIDRMDNMIKSSGKKIYLNAIKEKILNIKGIEDVNVYRFKSLQGHSVGVEIISNLTEEETIEQIKVVLNESELPKKIKFVKEFSLSYQGKKVF
ncbi:TPA: AMP-binding protein, partial [Listeria monocytogenes]|nr:AMP-binding protein [Listeria monocytogenes]